MSTLDLISGVRRLRERIGVEWPAGARETADAQNLLQSVAAELMLAAARDARNGEGHIDGGWQAQVHDWMIACFGEAISRDGIERNHRFLEEALELVQACGCTAAEAHKLVDYVFGRPVGETAQEIGGVMVTLAALCNVHQLNMDAAGADELARCWSAIDKIRAKQAAKPKHSPLPGPSAPALTQQSEARVREALEEARDALHAAYQRTGHADDLAAAHLADASLTAPKPEEGETAGYCKACGTMRSVAPCRKCGGELKAPHPDWEEPPVPDVAPIRALAREVGYAIGEHGTKERDLDLIAVPWREGAASPQTLAEHIAKGINGVVLAPEPKPAGRWSCNIQIDGWFKLIDLSVMPASPAPSRVEPVAKRDPMLNRSEEEWKALEEATVQVYGLRAGHTLTEGDVAALALVDRCQREDEESATDAYHRGLENGLRERGGDELVALEKRASEAAIARATESVMRRFAEQRADVAEFFLSIALAVLASPTPPDAQDRMAALEKAARPFETFARSCRERGAHRWGLTPKHMTDLLAALKAEEKG